MFGSGGRGAEQGTVPFVPRFLFKLNIACCPIITSTHFVNLLSPELFFLILAHSVYKM